MASVTKHKSKLHFADCFCYIEKRGKRTIKQEEKSNCHITERVSNTCMQLYCYSNSSPFMRKESS